MSSASLLHLSSLPAPPLANLHRILEFFLSVEKESISSSAVLQTPFNTRCWSIPIASRPPTPRANQRHQAGLYQTCQQATTVEDSSLSSCAPGHSDPTARPSSISLLTNPAVGIGRTPGQAHTLPHLHPTLIPRPRRHLIKMAPSATGEPAPMQLPVTSKASTINASVLHGPRDLRLVNFPFSLSLPLSPSFPRSRIVRLHEVRVPSCYFWTRIARYGDIIQPLGYGVN